MSLGSWRTFERISRDEGVAVMRAARAAGINFLDDARYDDEVGDAPIPTGYSEVVFGELFRAAGWARDEVVVANKLWWEHWPDENAAAELDGSLGRMGLDHVDVIYAIHPPAELPIRTVVEQVSGLIESGRARHWGTGMWTAAQHHEALDVCDEIGAPPPVCAQMATSLADHAGPDDPEMRRAFDRGPIGLVASYVLAGGTLTGKYLQGDDGRASDDDSSVIATGKRLASRVVELAAAWGVPPSHVAFAYAFDHPNLASIVFGARTTEQLNENVAAWSTYEQLDAEQRSTVRRPDQLMTDPTSKGPAADLTVAQHVVDGLRLTGIDTLFCLPGVQNDDFFDAMVDAPDIAPIVTRHEQGAAYMAMGAAQVTGRPAACCVVPGPGLLNAGAALSSAYWSNARVLAIVGEIADVHAGSRLRRAPRAARSARCSAAGDQARRHPRRARRPPSPSCRKRSTRWHRRGHGRSASRSRSTGGRHPLPAPRTHRSRPSPTSTRMHSTGPRTRCAERSGR